MCDLRKMFQTCEIVHHAYQQIFVRSHFFPNMPKVKHLGTLKKGKTEKVYSKQAVAKKKSAT